MMSPNIAGVSAKDVDVVELHDCFSTNELITYEALVSWLHTPAYACTHTHTHTHTHTRTHIHTHTHTHTRTRTHTHTHAHTHTHNTTHAHTHTHTHTHTQHTHTHHRGYVVKEKEVKWSTMVTILTEENMLLTPGICYRH